MEQFALPDDGANAAKKAKAMKQLKALVWEVDDDLNLSPFLEDRQTYLQQARANLTAMQQVIGLVIYHGLWGFLLGHLSKQKQKQNLEV